MDQYWFYVTYFDCNEPNMDKVFMWAYRTCKYIQNHADETNAIEIFNSDLSEDGEFQQELMLFSDKGIM